MKHLVCLILLSALSFPALANRDRREDWDFTVEDYAALKRRGRDIQLAPDSAWVPASFAQNLLSSLRFLLSRPRDARMTDGVSVVDLYHGHAGCELRPGASIAPMVDAAERQQQDILARVLGQWFTPVTEQNLSALVEVRPQVEEIVGRLLEDVEASGHCSRLVMIYHSYEVSSPRYPVVGSSFDARRNILTDNRTLQPTGFTPPVPGNSSTWMNLYSNIAQLAFLIDRHGGVHVTVGSTRQLSAVTGFPLLN